MVYSHSSIGIVCCQGGAIPWLTTVLGGGCYSMNHELPSICIGRTNMCHSFCLPRCIVHLHSQHFSAPVNIFRYVTPNLPSQVNFSSIDRDRAIIPATSHNLFCTRNHNIPLIRTLLEKVGYIQGDEHEK